MSQEKFQYKGGSPDPYYPPGTEPTCGVGAQGYDCYNRGQRGVHEDGLDMVEAIIFVGTAVVIVGALYAAYIHATKGLKFRNDNEN